MKFTCPSKTFLVGEYAVLNSGPAILLATPPYFSQDNNNFFDPHAGKGGFGASGARFLFKSYQDDPLQDIWKVWEQYHASSHTIGSGADIICQHSGGIVFFHSAIKKIEKLIWPFEDVMIVLIHTGYKILTHQHLKNENIAHKIKMNLPQLSQIVLENYHALLESNLNQFIISLQHYEKYLIQLDLVCENTQKLLSKIISQKEVIAAKGCGALGADVILTLINKKNKSHFLKWATSEKLNVIFADNQFAHGLEITL